MGYKSGKSRDVSICIPLAEWNLNIDIYIYLLIYISKQKTLSIYRKDARLPVQLQRAMAAEAEAAREARAKVIHLFYPMWNIEIFRK